MTSSNFPGNPESFPTGDENFVSSPVGNETESLGKKIKKKVKEVIKPENPPEAIVWYAMIFQYLWFLLGATYVVGSVVGWLLFFCLLIRMWFQDENTPPEKKTKVPFTLWIWGIGMFMEEVALIFGHLDYRVPIPILIKSSIGWAKGWAAIALYPIAGCLPIRKELIYRATCIVCFHTLIIAPLFIIAPSIGLPEILYVSPLRAVGGPSPAFFDVSFYEINLAGEVRTRLFTPWGPALGFVGNVYLLLALQEKDKTWRIRGVLGALFMAYICKSRLALISAVVVPIIVYVVMNLTKPIMLFLLGVSSFVGGITSTVIMQTFNEFMTKVKEARADSTRVRAELKKIAFDRSVEAPIWGHGVQQNGPHLVEFMPIGSHHTWAGLIFVKGIVGVLGLAIPMAMSFVVLFIRAQRHKVSGVAFGMLLILALYTLGENLEILVYLYWPGMIVMGMGFVTKPKPEEPKEPLVLSPSQQ